MKKPLLSVTAIAMFIAAIFLVINKSDWFGRESAREHANESREREEREEGEGGEENEEDELQSGAARQLTSWFQAKAFPDASDLTGKYMRAWQQHIELREKTNALLGTSRVEAATWTQLGYCTNGGTRIGGRIVCLAIDPNNSNNLWAGSASGGIWKSTNAGSLWAPVKTDLPVLGVSSIIVDPSNSNIIYAGTGEVYSTEAGSSNTGFNIWKTRGTYGIGVIKSVDGGAHWSQVMTKNSADLFGVQSLAFLPGSSTTILACTTDGVFDRDEVFP